MTQLFHSNFLDVAGRTNFIALVIRHSNGSNVYLLTLHRAGRLCAVLLVQGHNSFQALVRIVADTAGHVRSSRVLTGGIAILILNFCPVECTRIRVLTGFLLHLFGSGVGIAFRLTGGSIDRNRAGSAIAFVVNHLSLGSCALFQIHADAVIPQQGVQIGLSGGADIAALQLLEGNRSVVISPYRILILFIGNVGMACAFRSGFVLG